MSFNILTLTGEQIRAARALSRLEQTDLARLSGLSLETIKRLERIRGAVDANARTLRAIQDAFAGIGVHFDGDAAGRMGVLRYATRPVQVESARAASVLHRLVYHSRIRRSSDENLRPMLAALYGEAQDLLARAGVTGVMYAREGQLLQSLEGDQHRVREAYRTIACLPHHHSLDLIEDRPSTERQFPDFTFCCGQFPSDPAPGVGGLPTFEDDLARNDLTPGVVADLLGAARALQLATPRNARGAPGGCALAAMCLDRSCGGGRRQEALALQAH